jgi:uncharacterized protein
MTNRMDDDEVVGTFYGIPPARCIELLQSQAVGRVAWQSAEGPEILPVTYVWYEDSVVFRTSPYGPLSELSQPTDVAFEIDEFDQHRHQGWSVVVHGRAQGVARPDEVVRLWNVSGVPWAPGMRNLIVRITPTTVSGRQVAARPQSRA